MNTQLHYTSVHEAAKLAGGADPDASDRRTLTLLHIARTKLLLRADKNHIPLHTAETAAETRALLAAGADVNARDEIGCTPLHYFPDADQTRILLEHGADPNARNQYNQTPLHLADPDETKILLEHGADPNARDNDNRCPLHYADSDQVTVLLAAGAEPNARDSQGRTPLHLAHDHDSTKLLLAAGAEPNARDEYGATPLNHAISGEAKLLLAAGADPLLAYPQGIRINGNFSLTFRDPEVVAALKPQTASRLVAAHPYLADLPGAEKPEALLAQAAAENRMVERLSRSGLAAHIAEHAAQPAPERDASGIER